ncbi:hypothetical protein [Thiorhodovibrio frisius]|uniref:Uncharacterized protein n=1 Tax=Thiorhodovibrio frisius TaxID=631362 RepID=H8Z5E2_9GAMM|nr:hypothetical protein [Thiorhodovibrio frisius]EIC19488.1 hypothetical protein Thi970DRAFT_03066 [Thiorhodovibrio frisius]WPL20548.1 hypothetical protein Thiofri_00647 [Thiorhodovibrio frisius]
MREYVSEEKFRSSVSNLSSGFEWYFDLVVIRVHNLALFDDCEKLLSVTKGRYFDYHLNKNFESFFYKDKSGKNKQRTGRRVVGFNIFLRRPTDKVIKDLIVIMQESDYTISVIEIAIDFLCENRLRALRLLQYLAPYIVLPQFKRGPAKIFRPKIFGKKRIYSIRFKQGKIKNSKESQYSAKRLFKMYILKKGNPKHGSPACHTEFRLNGSEQISRDGINCLSDLVNFKFWDWYRERMYFMQANRTKAGRLLRKERGLSEASSQQNSVDFCKEFSKKRFLSHTIYHWRKDEKSRRGLKDSLQTWKTPW